MKLSEYAKRNSVTYQTAYNWWKSGILNAKQLPTGTIVVADDICTNVQKNSCVLYARVSTSEQKEHIERQMDRLRDFASAKGYKIINEFKEVASGLNENRKILNKILDSDDYEILVVEHKDRLCRFGFAYIEKLLLNKKQKIEIINESENDIIEDFVSIITCFCSKIYGRRGNTNRVKKILDEVKKAETE